jgi:hypothetical protein
MLRNSPTALRVLKSALNAAEDGQAGIQELGGNATMLFYQSEEGNEVGWGGGGEGRGRREQGRGRIGAARARTWSGSGLPPAAGVGRGGMRHGERRRGRGAPGRSLLPAAPGVHPSTLFASPFVLAIISNPLLPFQPLTTDTFHALSLPVATLPVHAIRLR